MSPNEKHPSSSIVYRNGFLLQIFCLISSDENPLSFYPGIKDGSKLNLLVIKKAEEGSSEARSLPQQKAGIHLLREEVSRVLRHYYTVSETESIVNELIKDLKNKVNNLNYDDLERLATALLQDQENVA